MTSMTISAPGLPGASPAPASSQLQLRGASSGALVTTLLVDTLIVGACVALVWFLRPSIVLATLTVLEVAMVLTLARATTGRTPGALVTRTAAVAAGTTHAPGLKRQLWRTTLSALLHLTVIGPLVSAAIGRDGQDWMDRICGTRTVDLKAKAVVAPTSASQVAPSGPIDPRMVAQGPAAMVRAASWDAPQGRSPHGRPAPVPSPGAPAATVRPASSTSAPSTPTAPLDTRPSAQAPQHRPTLAAAAHPAAIRSTPAASGEPRAPYPSAPPQSAPAATSPGQSAPPTGLPMLDRSAPASAAAHRAAAPGTPRAPYPSAPPVPNLYQQEPVPALLWVVVDSGQREPLDGILVIGHTPAALSPGERAVVVADTTGSVSPTHLRVGRGRGSVWVEDAGSAHGTIVRGAGGAQMTLVAGRRVKIPVGSVLVMGERTITVTDRP
ncbi:hypothetical protein I6B53_01480 [Schaalia sp. 19OD2882]|uniref:hypothetical protein n=1 Tax=Schaalia sp. 19OD2882 TaxID=2794089 RepID=UPI001C1EBA03|nr:hypothetical protein [Schaalia sp. 19OD2882]QWW19830.1 hypothetical protein I6B53_01480 [Schaalia sp. 19OD2882]